MKKLATLLITLIVALTTCFGLTACNKGTGIVDVTTKTITVGYTDYAPMNYTEKGVLKGFDTELAITVFTALGYDVKFKLIDWGNKYMELDGGTIDCIWNGFTANSADSDGVLRSEKVDFSYDYMLNKQVVVTTEAIAATITGFDSLAGKVGGVEEGSAGDTHLENLTGSVKKSCGSQLDALRELVLGTVDFVVLDEQLATAYVGNGDFQDITIVDSLSGDPEYYAIGFKKGSDLTAKVNAALVELAAEGKIDEIANKYNLVTAITDFSDQK